MTETKNETKKGTRKSEKQVSAERYMKFYEFLMYDPIYNDLSPSAKILYTYLNDKISLFQYKQEMYEEGHGTKSYVDKEGNLFLLADNTELTYFLNCSEPTLIKFKKELSSYGLLEKNQ